MKIVQLAFSSIADRQVLHKPDARCERGDTHSARECAYFAGKKPEDVIDFSVDIAEPDSVVEALTIHQSFKRHE
jgi:hypothetical protein